MAKLNVSLMITKLLILLKYKAAFLVRTFNIQFTLLDCAMWSTWRSVLVGPIARPNNDHTCSWVRFYLFPLFTKKTLWIEHGRMIMMVAAITTSRSTACRSRTCHTPCSTTRRSSWYWRATAYGTWWAIRRPSMPCATSPSRVTPPPPPPNSSPNRFVSIPRTTSPPWSSASKCPEN